MTEAQARDRFVQAAQQYLGMSEQSEAHREIIRLYNSIRPLPRGFAMTMSLPWCTAFVSAVAQQCGMTDIVPPECSAWYMMQDFKRLGEWTEEDAFIPKPGDVAFYDWSDEGEGDNIGAPDHVGIVERLQGGRIVTIEGNYGDTVARRYLSVDGRYLRGFGLPNFSTWAKQHSASGR